MLIVKDNKDNMIMQVQLTNNSINEQRIEEPTKNLMNFEYIPLHIAFKFECKLKSRIRLIIN